MGAVSTVGCLGITMRKKEKREYFLSQKIVNLNKMAKFQFRHMHF